MLVEGGYNLKYNTQTLRIFLKFLCNLHSSKTINNINILNKQIADFCVKYSSLIRPQDGEI